MQNLFRTAGRAAPAIPDAAKLEQEQASLVRVADSFRKVLVVRDPVVPRYNEQRVLVVGIEDFLSDESFLGL